MNKKLKDEGRKPKVLITSRSFGSVSNTPQELLEQAGLEVVFMGEEFEQAAFERVIPECEALIIGAHPFPEALLEKCKRLQIICKHGVGLDNIPLETARKQGIVVCNAPGTNAQAVADLTFGLMLACARKIVAADREVHAGRWEPVTGVDVYGKTLGLLGFGTIARNVARRARGFGMCVLACDPYVKELPEEFRSYVIRCDKEAILRNCDFVSVHLPLTEETRDLLAAAELSQMKPGSILIHTARGGIVNEQALYEALVSGRLSGAALDVSVREPMAAENPLRTLDNVILTPHIGMYSREAIEAVSLICARNIVARMRGERLQFQVT